MDILTENNHKKLKKRKKFIKNISSNLLTFSCIWSILIQCIIMDMYVFRKLRPPQKPTEFCISVDLRSELANGKCQGCAVGQKYQEELF